jgi:hypothetical protein
VMLLLIWRSAFENAFMPLRPVKIDPNMAILPIQCG